MMDGKKRFMVSLSNHEAQRTGRRAIAFMVRFGGCTASACAHHEGETP